MRQPYLAGNWKMHKTIPEAEELARGLVNNLSGIENKVMLAPPFTALPAVKKVVESTDILLGAQNMAAEDGGAFTGEISPLMLKDIGVDVVILGHSERRLVFAESDELINAKVRKALEHDFEIILCVGETLEQREAGKVNEIVDGQIRSGLSGVTQEEMEKITIAYEPVWAIGTGKTATPEDADDVHSRIRTIIKQMYSEGVAQKVTIQYGGSVKPSNVKELMAKENIDGALVGGASLKIEDFTAIGRFNMEG